MIDSKRNRLRLISQTTLIAQSMAPEPPELVRVRAVDGREFEYKFARELLVECLKAIDR